MKKVVLIVCFIFVLTSCWINDTKNMEPWLNSNDIIEEKNIEDNTEVYDEEKLSIEIRKMIENIDKDNTLSPEEIFKPIFDNNPNVPKKIIKELVWKISFEVEVEKQKNEVIDSINEKYDSNNVDLDDNWILRNKIKNTLEISITKWFTEDETYKIIYNENHDIAKSLIDKLIKEVSDELISEYAEDARKTQKIYEDNLIK